MRFALSTNWCNRRVTTGEEIVALALELGFDALELGFHTTPEQVTGFRKCRTRLPVTSVHAFCPVPISAPQGYPELYALASFDEDERAMARFHVRRNIAFAADMGATAVVLHAGRAIGSRWWPWGAVRRRRAAGQRLLDVLARELEGLAPELQRFGVTLGLENLPYVEGFPNEGEMAALQTRISGIPVRAWLDTGHHHVRVTNGWVARDFDWASLHPVGLHLNDSKGGDDHLAPGAGDIDFAAFASVARAADHLVLEPNPLVTTEDLKSGLQLLRTLFGC